MAGKIKGITLQINGDTTSLDAALNGVNTKARDIQSELKQVDRLLKLDPKNTELVAQKQKLLADAVSNTKDKLNKLKEAESQVQQQFKEGKVGEEQYRALQREIINAKLNLESLEDQAKKTNKALSEGQTSKQTGGNFKNIGAAAGIGAVGAAAAGLAAAGKGIGSADGLQKALNGIEAAAGVSTEEMESMREVMLNIYNNNFGQGFEDIGKAMSTISQQTGKSGKELETMTQIALTMRDTFEFDVNESVRSANMLMSQFGLSGEQAYNLIAQGAQKGLDKNGDLLDTVNEYSVHFKQLGIGADEMFNMLVNGSANGTFSVDKLGDAVKEFGIRTKDGSDTSKKAFQDLGLDADKLTSSFAAGGEEGRKAFEEVTKKLLAMNDPVVQNQSGVALFGTMWEDLGVKGIEALTNINGSISTTNDALAKINQVKYDSFGEAVAGIGRQFETGVFIPLGEKILPKLNEFAAWISENMPQLQANIESAMGIAGQVFDGLANAIQFVIDNSNILIPVLAGVTGAIAAQAIIGLVTDLYGKWKLATEAQSASQVILNAVMSANPFGVVALAIGALITVGVLLYKNWDTISEKASALGTNISNIFEEIKNGISDKINAAKDAVSGAIEKIKGFFDFDWELPKIKLPHFDIEGKFSLYPPQIPSFDVDWYKNGAIFNSPSVIGVGEAGTEAVLPIEKIDGIIASAIEKAGSAGSLELTVNTYSVLDGKVIAKSTSKQQAQFNNKKSRALGVPV